MTEYAIVPTETRHIAALAGAMRKADVEEVWASSRLRPLEALTYSALVSRNPRTGMADGEVLCIFGVADNGSILGGAEHAPWMLATDALPKHALPFLKASHDYIAELRQDYAYLRNHVDARNTLAIRWLRWLGFDILASIPFGPDQLPFHPFEMRGDA